MSKRLIWISSAFLAVAIVASAFWLRRTAAAAAGFAQLMNRGNGLLEKGDAILAIDVYNRALRLSPESTDVRLNLANAYLLAGRTDDAARMCRQTLELDANSAAAYYLLGCALLRGNQPEPAAEAFQQSWKIDPAVPALDFQTGMAQEELGQIPDAIRDFENVIRAVPDHPSAHFQLSRLYRRAGRADDAARELAEHQKVQAHLSSPVVTVAALERCKYTQPLSPFILGQPDPHGIPVRFAEETRSVRRAGDRLPRSAGRHRL